MKKTQSATKLKLKNGDSKKLKLDDVPKLKGKTSIRTENAAK